MKAVGRTGGLAVGIAVAALVTARPPDRLTAQSLWRPDERVLISDFSYIRAIAASPSMVVAATTHGLTIYDRLARAWQLPVTAPDGYPVAPVRVALADVVGNAVWFGTEVGWARYDVDIHRWEEGYAAGGVNNLMIDAGDPASGVYVQTGAGWGFLARGMPTPILGKPLPPAGRRVIPLTPEAALQLAPAADALRAFLLTDARLRTARFTSAARTPDRSELYFGTSGMGVVRFDPITTQQEPLPFGLLAPRSGALAVDANGVWVASLSRVGERSGLTWVAADLSAAKTFQGAGVTGYGFLEGRRLLASGPFLWLACERGVLKIDPGSERSQLFEARGVLPEAVLSLAPAPDGVWVGTARGLARITSDDRVLTIGTLAHPVLSLLAVHDSLWVGTTAGLGVLRRDDEEVGVPPEIAEQPSLRAPILALATVGDVLVVVTTDQFAWRDPATSRWTFLHARTDLGAITALAGDPEAGGVWIAGTTGVAFWALPRGNFHVLRAPDDVPAAVHDVAVDAGFVWVATDSGLVRFTRSAALGR